MASSTRVFSLSFQQQGIWLHQQQAPDSTVYSTGMALRILSETDPRALREKLQGIVDRHPMLRAVFTLEDGQPVQWISDSQAVSLTLADASGWDEERLRSEVAAAHRTPYDLENGPLFRAHLFSQSSDRHVLLMGAHHLVTDASSWLLVLDEFVSGVKGPVLGLDYCAYTTQQADVVREQGPELSAYWRTQLADVPTRLEMPTDALRPAEQRFQGGSEFFQLSPELTTELVAVAKREKVTLYSLLLAAFEILLARYSQLDRFIVGVPASGRTGESAAMVVGNFISLLPIVADLRDGMTAREHVRQVWRTLLMGIRNQAYPFSRIVQDLNIPHSAAAAPLAQVLFSFPQAAPEVASFLLAIPGAEDGADSAVAPYALQQQDGGFDIGLEMVRTASTCVGVFKYNTDLFSAGTIQQMIRHFRMLLEGLTTRTGEPVADLPLLTDSERHQILEEWNRTGTDASADRCIHRLFEEQVERTPDAIAIAQGDRTLTYRELNARSNRLAHYLIARGVGPEVLVGICLPRSIDMVVAVLGVLKAGGAYVPLDPGYPKARLQLMLDDAKVSALLTESELAGAVGESLSQEACVNPVTSVSESNLACCIFTSGSTGRPKGVLVEHRGIPNLAGAQIAAFGLHAGSRVLQFASFSFDAFVSELFTTLLAGAQLCLPPTGAILAGEVLHRELQANRITAVTLPPTVLATLPPYQFETLVVAGEACPPALARQWAGLCDRLINAYGPTEATVCAAMIRLTADDMSGSRLPIGYPIANARLSILDRNLQPVPAGVPGELHIGGIGLARGYLNQPELTQERFLTIPERVYKSGDQCRYLPDGKIEFLGRMDNQVKVRGFRIELGEVENQLLRLDGVSQAVAIVREDEPGVRRLVAYVVGKSSGDALRQALSDSLPDYMVPSAFVMLAKIPLTPNGKIDRLALPAPDYSEVRANFAAPRNAIETALTKAFADVLRIPEVGIHDNFFTLGGDSILSIGIASRAGRDGYAVRVNDIFRHPTVAQLAAVVTSKNARVDGPAASQDLQRGDAPLLPIQRWFLETNEASLHHFNQYFLLGVRRPVEPAELAVAVSELLRHHDALRFRYTKDEGGWRQEYLAPRDRAPQEVVELSGPPEDQRAHIDAIGKRTHTSLDPLAGDLVRFVYFRASAGDSLLIAIHHLAVDGVSWRIFLEDLTTLLDGGALPAKTSSYADWGNALREAAENGRFDAQVSGWLSAGAGAEFPVRAPGGADGSHDLTFSLTPERTDHLLRTLPELHAVTLDSVLLAALTETLCRWSGAATLRIAFESHGRQQLSGAVNTDRTVGWFTSAYPLVIPRFAGSAVRQIRYTLDCIRRVPGGGLGFGALRDFHPDVAVREKFAALPAPRIVYNYLGQLDALSNSRFGVVPEASGLSASPHFRSDALIESNARILDGQLQVNWTVSSQIEVSQARALFRDFEEEILRVIADSLENRERVLIPADFANANLSIDQLERLVRSTASGFDSVYCLSTLQSGMLFQSRLTPGSGTYTEQNLFHVTDPAFDPDRLVAAVQSVVNRHDNLRAGFELLSDGEAVQVIYRNVALPVTRLDWSGLFPQDYHAFLRERMEQERFTDFDFGRPPLLRLAVIAGSDNTYDLLLTFHHVLMDRWSVDLFWFEVRATYAGQALPTPGQYESYIGHLRRQPFDEAFWRGYLRGFSAPTPLPGLTRVSPEEGPPRSTIVTLSQEETEQLASFARKQGVTLNVVFGSAWAALLARYTRETDLVFGMVTSGRTAPVAHVENISGLLINTLPFRVRLTDRVTATELLRQVAETQVQLQQREHSALLDVQRVSDAPSGTSLFHTIFLFQNTPRVPDESCLWLKPGWAEPGRNGYPLTALVAPGEPAELILVYDSGRYDADTVERLGAHWRQLLLNMMAQPHTPVLTLPMLAAEPVAPMADFGPGETIHAMFERQVERAPDSVALTFEGEQVTYSVLNARANRLACRLMEGGVRPGTLVPVVMGRTPELIVSLLAVLKAGGAYVPIDPTYPPERIAFTLRDCGAALVLTDRCLADGLPQDGTRYVFASDPLTAYPDTNPASGATADHLAYVIYTSGSTGQPKGALIPHCNVWRLFAATDAWFGFGAADVWTLFHSAAFDFSVWEMWGALCYGGRLVIVPYAVSRDPQAFLRMLSEQRVTVLNQTPSAFRQLVAVDGQDPRPLTLRYVIFGGEALEFESLRPWFARHGDTAPQLVNMYGITETTVHVTYQPICVEDLDRHRGRSRIGCAIPDLRLHILDAYGLDAYGAPVPVGVAGELHVGGAGLARGYLNRPELTAERFFEHPEFGRLYKTGDLCRWLPDGNMEYLGRTDFQVKIRGFRVELGEIESALMSEPGVREAVALVREDQPGDQRIVAYVVGSFDGESDRESIRERLARRLPEYMVPSAFVRLESMPLTANGKLDRGALPVPDFAVTQKQFVAPRSAVEGELEAIWREVLGVNRVGIHDNFFALGGHSLTATRLAAQIRDRFQTDLPIRTIFETKSLAEMARAVEIAKEYQRAPVAIGANDEEF